MIHKKLKRREKNKSALNQPASVDPQKKDKIEDTTESSTESYNFSQYSSDIQKPKTNDFGQLPTGTQNQLPNIMPKFREINPPKNQAAEIPSMTQSSFLNPKPNHSASPERKSPINPQNALQFKPKLNNELSNEIPKAQFPPNYEPKIPVFDQSKLLPPPPPPPNFKTPFAEPQKMPMPNPPINPELKKPQQINPKFDLISNPKIAGPSNPPELKTTFNDPKKVPIPNPPIIPEPNKPQQINPKFDLISNPKIAVPLNPPPLNLPQNQQLPNLPGGPAFPPVIKSPNVENLKKPASKNMLPDENLSPTRSPGIDIKTPGESARLISPKEITPVFSPKETEFFNGFSEFLDLVIPYVNFVSIDPMAPSTLSKNIEAAIASSSGKLKTSLDTLKKQVLCVECKTRPYQMAFGCCHQFCFDCAQKVISSQSDAKRFIVDREIGIYKPKCSKCKYQLNRLDVIAANYNVINETLTNFASEGGSALQCKGCSFFKHPYQFFDGHRCHHLCKECIGVEIRKGAKQCRMCGSKFDFLHEALPDQGYCDGCDKILFTIGNSLTSVCSKGHLHCLDCLNLGSPVCIKCREPLSSPNKNKIERIINKEKTES